MKKFPIKIKIGNIKKLNSYKLMFEIDQKLRNKSMVCKSCKNEIWLKQKRKINGENFSYSIFCNLCHKEYTLQTREDQNKKDNVIMVINEK